MLSRALKDHQAKQVEHKSVQERRRKEALAAADTLAKELVDTLNYGVETAYKNQKRLDAEAKALQVHASKFVKQTQQWLAMVEGFNRSLKELGDVEHWAKTIESDMKEISMALEYAYTGTISKKSAKT
ncbi:biogenesis of lysosome-related organelles complex 1 subunit 1-like [Oscarella lobularis]|uniref:biogenesis of lysosome-related organelles complex 1 subunit 1-like n=1 Tax=Oscarella lobularis TaxID=121494 RepID=UPI0033140A13